MDDSAKRSRPGPSARGQGGSAGEVSICAGFFGTGLEAVEVRDLVLALEGLGAKVHLKPRWLEENGIEREDRGT